MEDLHLKLFSLKERVDTWQFTKLFTLDCFNSRRGRDKESIMAEMPDYDKYLEKKREKEAEKVGVPPEFIFMYEIPYLTKKQEWHLFRKYNFCKYKYKRIVERVSAMKSVNSNHLIKVIKWLEFYYKTMNEIKTILVGTNSRLVMSLARKMNLTHDIEVVLSEGCLGLVAAVDYFDYRRGVKFVTYCYPAIFDYFQKYKRERKKHSIFDALGWNEQITENDIADPSTIENKNAITTAEDKALVEEKLSKVTLREREVIRDYYGLNGERLTLRKIGKRLKISTERVRQIRLAGMRRMTRITK